MLMKMTRILALALIPFLLAASASANWVEIVEYKTIPDGENLTLHIAYPPDHQPGDQRPAVVFFFGGGWKRGQPGQFYPHIKELSKQEIVGISAQYRTKESHDASPVECVKDGRSAIRYVREHAAEMGIDPDKILAGGGSAGGHVAACTAIESAADDGGDNLEISARPAALILFNPVISVGPDGYAHGYVKNAIKEWEAISPLHQINAQTPPTLILIGTEDNVSPKPMVEAYEAAAKAAGSECEVVFYEGATHGFFNKPEYSKQTIENMMAFLRTHGYLN